MNQDVGAPVQYPSAYALRDAQSQALREAQSQAPTGGFAPCPPMSPNPCGSNRALSATPPVVSWQAPEPRGRTSAELPYANAGGFNGSLDFTLEPTLPEGPAVYAQEPTVYAQAPSQGPVVYAQGPLVYAHDPMVYAQAPPPGFQQYGSIPTPAPEQPKPAVTRGLAFGKPLDVMETFPTLFTTFCFGTFITPIILSYHVGRDPQVLFWIGDYINWVIFLPVLYVWAHIYHTMYRVPSKVVVVICLIGSCIVILVLGEHVLLDAYGRANELTARDCETFPRKMQLQRSWEAARTYYANCMTSMAGDLGISYESAVATYRIGDCSDYPTQLDQNSDWTYLASLEEQHLCAGWCEPGHAIWTLGTVRDSCSSTVADIMNNKIRWTMLQVVVYTVIVLCLASVMLVAIGPNIWRYNERQCQYV